MSSKQISFIGYKYIKLIVFMVTTFIDTKMPGNQKELFYRFCYINQLSGHVRTTYK